MTFCNCFGVVVCVMSWSKAVASVGCTLACVSALWTRQLVEHGSYEAHLMHSKAEVVGSIPTACSNTVGRVVMAAGLR